MLKRRTAIQWGGLALASQGLGFGSAFAVTASHQKGPAIMRAIPSSGELIPTIGMGTSRTFDQPGDSEALTRLSAVMQEFLNNGGSVIDSSPMYGRAESRVGDVLRAMPERPPLFAATKVWTTGEAEGIAQMEESAQRMAVDRFDLIAIHNLQDWRTHLKTLKNWKDQGKVRYIGVTTSHGRDHNDLLDIMRTQPLDFVQFSYNIEDRLAEKALLPLAGDRGIATMINRPFQRGSLFARSRDKPLPEVAADLQCSSWGQFFLKFILSHPASTNIIPATSKLHHMQDNMMASFGTVPDAKQREEMLRTFESL
ncbi:MAG: diketogulonate reductase-like aldo/keto reductase [Halieaceae bacterium]|jgi:diketogulonate reductase-like aldo/keto reductase